MENQPIYQVYQPTHRKLTLTGPTRHAVLQQLLDLEGTLPVDDPIVLRYEGELYVAEMYYLVVEGAQVTPHAMVMQV